MYKRQGDNVCDHSDPCVGTYDCNDDCNGTASLDDCGVCSGGNTGHAADSDKDECGVCFGDGVLDCAGVCNGLSELDECGLCEGGNECYEFELTFADGTVFAYDLHVEDGMHIDDYFGETSYDWEVESGIITLADGSKIYVTSEGPSRDHGAGHILWDGYMITSETYDSNGNSYAFDIVPDSSDDMFDFMSNGGTADFSTAVYYGEINGNSSAVAVLDFGGDKTATSGTFTIQFPAQTAGNAIIQIA